MLCCSNGCCTSSNLKSLNNLINTTSSFLLCGSGTTRHRGQEQTRINEPHTFHHQITQHPHLGEQSRFNILTSTASQVQHPQQPFTMVLQPDFRKVSGLSSTTLKLLEAVENDHDSTTAAALAAVEKRGEMLVRILDPRVQFSRGRQDMVRKWLDMETPSTPIHFTEIVKRPGQTLGLYIREGNGLDRYDGVFISRIAIESAVFNSGCLGVGDEILAVNLIDVRNMSLDDVVIIMSIPRRLVLTIRGRRGGAGGSAQGPGGMHGAQKLPSGSGSGSHHPPHPPVVVMKKDLYYGGENNGESTGTSEEQQQQPQMMGGAGTMIPPTRRHQMYQPPPHMQGQQFSYHYNTYQPTYSNIGVGVYQPRGEVRYGTSVTTPRHQQQSQLYSSTSSHYANYPQSVPPPDVTLSGGSSTMGGFEYEESPYQHRPSSRGIAAPSPALAHPDFYQPPPPLLGPSGTTSGYSLHHPHPSGVITDQPRSSSTRFVRDYHQQRSESAYDSHPQPPHYYPRTLESLAEKVHTFYTAPRPLKNGGSGRAGSGRGSSNLRLSGSDYRLGSGRAGLDYGSSLPRGWSSSGPKAPSSLKGMQLLHPRTQQSSAASLQRSSLLSRPILDYSSDTEAQIYSSRSRIMSDYLRSNPQALQGPASASLITSRFSGSSSRLGPSSALLASANFRSNSLPRDFNMFKRTPSSTIYDMEMMDDDLTQPVAPLPPTRSILRKSSAGAGSNVRSSVSRTRQPTSAYLPYRRTPSTSAIYEQLKSSRTPGGFPISSAMQRDPLKDLNSSASRRSEFDAINELNNWLREEEDKHRGIKKSSQVLSLLGQRSSSPLTTGGRRSLLSSAGAQPPTIASFNLPTSISFRDNLSSTTLSRLANITSSSSGFNLRSSTSMAGESKAQLSPLITSSKLRKSQLTSGSTVSPSLQNLLSKSSMSPAVGGGDLMQKSSSTSSNVSVVPNLLIINPSEFIRYKPGIEGASHSTTAAGVTGMLNLHLLAGRALRSSSVSKHHGSSSGTATFDPTSPAHSQHHRDLYCVIELDRTHRSRTVVYTGDQNFDWNEYFNIDLYNNYDLDFLIYSWDPELRHRLCYKSSLNLVELLNRNPGSSSSKHNLAIKVEPRGTLYVKIEYCRPEIVYQRTWNSNDLFGEHLNTVMETECQLRNECLAAPSIVLKCVEEIERRGLDIVGVYRLCGGGEKKEICKNSWRDEWIKIKTKSLASLGSIGGTPTIMEIYKNIIMSAEVVPDINVVGGVLKDYLLALPTPLIPPGIYNMLRDAMDVCLPDDPEGNSKLLVGVVECLEKWERSTLFTLLDHLTLITSLSSRNRMTATELSKIFAPLTMIHYQGGTGRIDEDEGNRDFPGCIRAFEYLLNGWGVWRGSSSSSGSTIMAGLGGLGSGSNTSSSGVCRTVLGSEDKLKKSTKNGKNSGMEQPLLEEQTRIERNGNIKKTNGHTHSHIHQESEPLELETLDTVQGSPQSFKKIKDPQAESERSRHHEELHSKGLIIESSRAKDFGSYDKYLNGSSNSRTESTSISSTTKKLNGQEPQTLPLEQSMSSQFQHQPQHPPPIPRTHYHPPKPTSTQLESSSSFEEPMNELQMKLNRRRRSIDAEEAAEAQSVPESSGTKKVPPVPPPKPIPGRSDSIKKQDSLTNQAPPPVPPRRGSIPSSPDTSTTLEGSKPISTTIAPPPVPPRLGKSMSMEQPPPPENPTPSQEPEPETYYPPPTTQPPMLDLSTQMLSSGSAAGGLHHSPHLSSSFDPSISSDCYTINEEEDLSCWYHEEQEDIEDNNIHSHSSSNNNHHHDQHQSQSEDPNDSQDKDSDEDYLN